MKLIIGLGNPGSEYEKTRHNAGFIAVDTLAKSVGGAWTHDAKRKAETCKCVFDGTTVLLAKPDTFMNLSGDAATALVSFYKVALEDVLIVHDELDLPPGKLQFKSEGGDAGHNGVSSILERLGTNKIARLRIGIGRPSSDVKAPTADYVLGVLSTEDTPNALDTTAAMRDWIESGLTKAMNRWNQR